MKKIKYIKHKKFIKMTKQEKLKMEETQYREDICSNIDKILIIHIPNKKGYSEGAFFVLNEKKGWVKVYTHDVWEITSTLKNETKPVRGDFELGGIVFFKHFNQMSLLRCGEIKLN